MICKYCGEDKNETDFEVANVVNGKEYRRKKCRTCKVKTQRTRVRKIAAEHKDLKKGKICSICGFSDHRALQYHHRDPKTKKFNVSDAIRLGYGMDSILAEIEKCDILCANCHSILHYKQHNGDEV
jgi:hypothetical protein